MKKIVFWGPPRDVISNYFKLKYKLWKREGGRRSSLPTILWLCVRIPNTTSSLFSIFIKEIVNDFGMRKGRK